MTIQTGKIDLISQIYQIIVIRMFKNGICRVDKGISTPCLVGDTSPTKKFLNFFHIILKGIQTQVRYFALTEKLQNLSYLTLPPLKLNPSFTSGPRYSMHYIIKFIDFMSIYYVFNLDIV